MRTTLITEAGLGTKESSRSPETVARAQGSGTEAPPFREKVREAVSTALPVAHKVLCKRLVGLLFRWPCRASSQCLCSRNGGLLAAVL